ncbi:cryptochrome/photolyase family protein [Eilatimonas milleporae]|uniref:Deoxyribodipyrimidine photo-lyase n=1 Tax=Eilatimonas milleporae TaxID=911205 RepID=A0A3M0CL31_9PROT|nr:deoxyribodipyrimidine photo-lyase [Eilatimonas milleporae]RMB07736.1 deoxyribodipyrimidine photo-lyase [Eilatimonas milleporae]
MSSCLLLITDTTLRLADHPALVRAGESGAPVIPLYVHDDDGGDDWTLGGAARWWLGRSLAVFQDALEGIGSRLIIRKGDAAAEVAALAAETGAETLFLTRSYDRHGRAREAALKRMAAAEGLTLKRYGGHLLFEPDTIATQKGDPYTVFSPFWRACLKEKPPKPPLDAPKALAGPVTWPDSLTVADLDLAPKPVDWAAGLRGTWTPGEGGALARADAFIVDSLASYKKHRDRPDLAHTSALSPHIRFGEISTRTLWHRAQEAMLRNESLEASAEHFTRELGWREFSYHLLYHFPDLADAPLRTNFTAFPWRQGQSAELTAWQKGRTGFPIIDAGMRQLWRTGWMHNRVRMIVASFLVKELLWHWRDGEAWFWDTLVDADPASNAASWQWAAGCGADAAPYFRIFNPILQGEKFDPEGAYVRTYVPELAHMPPEFIHKPWEAPALVLSAAGVTLGDTYPAPMVDRKQARDRALKAFEEVKTAQTA